jgi:hypothetical protein
MRQLIAKKPSYILSLVLVSFFFAGFSPSSFAAQKSIPVFQIKFVISEPCSLIRFVDTISERDHTTAWLKEWFFSKRSPAQSIQDKELLEKYKKHLDSISDHYRFKDETGREMNLNQRIACLAANCTTLQQLLPRIKQSVKSSDFPVLKETYSYFEPIHKELVWDPRLSQLNAIWIRSSRKNQAGRLFGVQFFQQSALFRDFL